MAFKTAGTLGDTAPVKLAVIAKNSEVITELDSIKVASDFALRATGGVSLYGHVTGIRTNSGVGLNTTGVAGAEMGSYVGTYTFASDNQTVAKSKVELDISKFTIYSAEVDVAIGTTPGSDLRNYFMDLVDEDTLNESTAATTACQYATFGADPDDTAKALVTIYESNIFGPLAA